LIDDDTIGYRFPEAEESVIRLHDAGWSVVCSRFKGPTGPVWIVSGYNGENQILTASWDRDEAWWHACLQARSAGMLRLSRAPSAIAPDG